MLTEKTIFGEKLTFLFLRYTVLVTSTITEPYYNSILVSRIYNSTPSIMVLF